jgi:NADH:ubiquinone oxidoreductase subunit C
MSSDHAHSSAESFTYPAIKSGLSLGELQTLLVAKFALVRDPRDSWGLTLIVPTAKLVEVATYLRDEPSLQFAQLLDIAGVDYLAYPNHRGPRFAAIYNFKSVVFTHRLRLKVELDEEQVDVPTLIGLYKIANWQEREVYDQLGLNFVGHPNLKRLLNHHEFVGHPLRKDYPCQKRQKLSVNDSLVDQLESRLQAKGYVILDRGQQNQATPITFKAVSS